VNIQIQPAIADSALPIPRPLEVATATTITELADALKAAHDFVENSTDEETAEKSMGAIYAAEENILAKKFTQADAIEANAKILSMPDYGHEWTDEVGVPTYSDTFARKLARKILKALLPDELGKIAVAA
jgi:hypothetical protein